MSDSEDKLSKMCAYAYEKAKKAIAEWVYDLVKWKIRGDVP